LGLRAFLRADTHASKKDNDPDDRATHPTYHHPASDVEHLERI
jgi:hypothetical protein